MMRKYLYEDLYRLEEKHWWHISKRRIVQSLIKNYNIVKDPKILDVGCGTGKNMEELLIYGPVWGLDNSQDAINFCKDRGLKNLKLGDAEDTHLKSRSFNIATLLDVLEHTDDNKTLQEMKRILKKGGLLIITVPAFSWLWSDWDVVLHHKRRYTINQLKDILKLNGLLPLKITYLYSFLVIPAFIIRKIKKIFFKKTYPSDFKLSNSFLNFLLNILSKLEFALAQKIPIPIGTTILVIARND